MVLVKILVVLIVFMALVFTTTSNCRSTHVEIQYDGGKSIKKTDEDGSKNITILIIDGENNDHKTHTNLHALFQALFHRDKLKIIQIPYNNQTNHNIEEGALFRQNFPNCEVSLKSKKYIVRTYNQINSPIICDNQESLQSAEECFIAANSMGYTIKHINEIEIRNGKKYDWAAHGCFRNGLKVSFFNNDIYKLHPSPTSTYKNRMYICRNRFELPLPKKQSNISSFHKSNKICPRLIVINVHANDRRNALNYVVKLLMACNPTPIIYFIRYNASQDEKEQYFDDENIDGIRNLLAEFCPRRTFEKPYYYLSNIICIPHFMFNDNTRYSLESGDDGERLVRNKIKNVTLKLTPILNKTIIQIGAHVGNTINDPIFEMADENTNLILIEPVPYLFEQLKLNYKMKLPHHFKNIIFINKAITDFVGEIEFTIPSIKNNFQNLPYWVSQLSSSNPYHLKKHIPDLLLETINVQTTTINSIVKKYKLKEIYLLKTDAEGMDYKILMSYDFKKNAKPSKILFEHNHMDGTFTIGENYKSLLDKLEALGYKKITNHYRLYGSKADTLMVLERRNSDIYPM
jgi:FkbM family methyltransferase